MIKKRHIQFILIFLFGLAILYGFILFDRNPDADIWHQTRDIDSFSRLLLNGYLGPFFRLKFFGNLHWIVFFVFLYYIRNFLRLDDWKQALLLIFFIGSVIISLKGYYNYRYQLTFYPLSLTILLLLAYDSMRSRYSPKLMAALFFAAVFLIGMNHVVFQVAEYFEDKTTTESVENQTQIQKPSAQQAKESLSEKITQKIKSISEPNLEIRSYPIFDSINEMNIEGKVLVNNLPLFFYYTDLEGVFYWCGNDKISAVDGRYPLLENRSIEEVHSFVFDSLNCHYIFNYWIYREYEPRFDQYLDLYGDTLLFEDGFTLYRLKDE